MKKKFSILLAVILLLCAVSCGKTTTVAKDDSLTSDFIAMDTFFSLKIGKLSEGGDSAALFDECRALVEEIDSVISAHRQDSEVYALNGDIDILADADASLISILTFANELSLITGGAYDPSLGALSELWNVKGGGPVPTDADIAAAMSLCGTELFTVTDGDIYKEKTGAMLDLGGIGKGHAAQRLTELLFSRGASWGIVSAGRTVGVFGQKPDGSSFKIGIADPFNSEGVVGYLYTDGGFVSVAGDYEIFFTENGKRYHHILDPDTGRPSDSGLTAVAVLSQNGAAADALSTALMVMGYEEAMRLYSEGDVSFEAVFITSEGDILLTDGLTGDRFEAVEGVSVVTGTVTDAVETSADTSSETVTEGAVSSYN